MYRIGHANCYLGRAAIKELNDEGRLTRICLLLHDRDELEYCEKINLEKFLGHGLVDVWQNVTDPYPKIHHYLRKYTTLVCIGKCFDRRIPNEEFLAAVSIVEDRLGDAAIYDFAKHQLLKTQLPAYYTQRFDEIESTLALLDKPRFREFIRTIRDNQV